MNAHLQTNYSPIRSLVENSTCNVLVKNILVKPVQISALLLFLIIPVIHAENTVPDSWSGELFLDSISGPFIISKTIEIKKGSTFSENTFYGQVARKNGWAETYGGSARYVNGRYVPNLPLMGVGCAFYVVNLIHTGVLASSLKEKTSISFEADYRYNTFSFGMRYDF